MECSINHKTRNMRATEDTESFERRKGTEEHLIRYTRKINERVIEIERKNNFIKGFWNCSKTGIENKF